MIEQMQTRRTFLATFAGASALVLAACGGGNKPDDGAAQTDEPTGVDAENKSEGSMTYQQYMDAAVDDPVVLECFVQGKQAWASDKASIYAADADGGYFIYNATCDQETYDKLVEGTKIFVTGFKAEWSGEVEVAEGAEIKISDVYTYVVGGADVTDKLGTDELINYQNQKVSFTGLKVEASKDPDGKDVAFLYSWDGSGTPGDDLYFNVSDGKATYSFTVESFLTDENTDVYKAVQALNVGDTIDAEGFLYWYEGPNPHITKVTVK